LIILILEPEVFTKAANMPYKKVKCAVFLISLLRSTLSCGELGSACGWQGDVKSGDKSLPATIAIEVDG